MHAADAGVDVEVIWDALVDETGKGEEARWVHRRPKLSQQRADSVASSLITQGVEANRIRTSGMGPANPIASNSTAEGKAQNRRVEITLSPIQ